jgi:SAM-dependent methyltransferase
MSSGYRLVHAGVVRGQPFLARDFDIVQEILVRAYANGFRVAEVPFHYRPRRHGASHARVLKFGVAYVRTFRSLWNVRNSIDCADYDARAFDSAIPLQRYWQRRRFRHVVALVGDKAPVLFVGCASSRVVAALPKGSVAVDLHPGKLRYARRYGRQLVQAAAVRLPFRDAQFPGVVCSQLLDHVVRDPAGVLDELCRVLQPGGRLVLDMLDYGQWQWHVIERIYRRIAPGADDDLHRARFAKAELVDELSARGLLLEATRAILRSELILAFRKES